MKCGIVDVGSNTMRLSIYQWNDADFQLLLNKKEMAGLAGYIQDGILSEHGIQAACQILAGFQELLKNFQIDQFYVFGTAALRNIANTEDAVNAIRSAVGVEIEVLSGAEEAAFSFLGATVGGGAPDRGLLADIGGGSTELVSYQGGTITSGCSLPVGSLSLFSRYVSGLFPSKEERRALRSQVERELERAGTAGQSFQCLTGVGGTIRAAAKLCSDLSGTGGAQRMIQSEELKSLYHRLKKGGQTALRQILRCVPDRVHTILPGLAILTAIIKAYQVERIVVSTYGVREGYLLNRIMGVNGNG